MKTTKLLIISILSFSLCNIQIYAQENISLKNDIFSGVNGQIYNPTHFLYNPNKWDTNLIGGDISFNNNYGYISQQSVLGALKNNPQGFSLNKISQVKTQITSKIFTLRTTIFITEI